MKRGPTPKPTALKILTGVTDPRRLNPFEASAAPGLPECPPELSDAARAVWHRMGTKLVESGLITGLDEVAFAGLCQSYADWLACTKTTNEQGLIVRVNGQAIPHPSLSLGMKLFKVAHQMAQEFGLSPSARTRVSVTTPPKEEDPMADFLKGAPVLKIAE